MARKKNRMAVLKRQREQRKAEKKEAKRLRRLQRREDAGTEQEGTNGETNGFEDGPELDDAPERHDDDTEDRDTNDETR